MKELNFSVSQPLQPHPQKLLVLVFLLLLIAGTIALTVFSWRHSLLLLIGSLFGLSLYHASFGFASAYRRLFLQRDVSGLLAQVLMLGIATLLFLPFLVGGTLAGQPIRGAVAPIALQGAIGAFLFGVGMQLGSGCACGTLYTIGGGSSMMLLTLLTFMGGSFGASLSPGLWQGLPQHAPISLVQTWGWWGGGLQLLLLSLIGVFLWHLHKKQPTSHSANSAQPLTLGKLSLATWIYGPWPLAWGAVALALLNWLTLLVAGRPWGVTWGFTLWGAKFAQLLGWQPSTSEFWRQGVGAAALEQSLFADYTSVTNLGVILGAALAAALAGRLTWKAPQSRLALVAALIGGGMMGYGARLAFGCNVGAYFGGIASTSLHGWLWIGFALLGTALGVKLRPFFQLQN